MAGIVAFQTENQEFHAVSHDTDTDNTHWTWSSGRLEEEMGPNVTTQTQVTAIALSWVAPESRKPQQVGGGFLTVLPGDTTAFRPLWPTWHPDADAQKVLSVAACLLHQGFLSAIVCCMELKEWENQRERESEKERGRETEGDRRRLRQRKRETENKSDGGSGDEKEKEKERECVSLDFQGSSQLFLSFLNIFQAKEAFIMPV